MRKIKFAKRHLIRVLKIYVVHVPLPKTILLILILNTWFPSTLCFSKQQYILKANESRVLNTNNHIAFQTVPRVYLILILRY